MTIADNFEPPPSNDFVRPVAFTALIVVGAWNLAGWLCSEGPLALRLFMGAITLTFEVLSFNVSAQKARADDRQVSANVRRYWFWALVMCCGWSVFCAHHALVLFTPDMSDMQRAPAYAVLSLAAFIIPVMPWAIERTERAPVMGGSPIPERAPVGPPTPSTHRSMLGRVGGAALAVGAITMPAGAHALASPTMAHEPVAGAPAASGDAQAWRAQARALWAAGERNKAKIARLVGRPRETVRRELRALGA